MNVHVSSQQVTSPAASPAAPPSEGDRSLLIVDEDKSFSARLARALSGKGYDVTAVSTVAEGIAAVGAKAPAFAVVDIKSSDGNALDVIARLKAARPEARGIVLTGYGNIASAVGAVKVGAYDYLQKPAAADEVDASLRSPADGAVLVPTEPMSADRVRWEHIQRVFEAANRNVSATARLLRMHRRTLQRILSKRAPT